METEVFVHGALCCSRSGCCLFSSWLGGWSGNRGKCKQPCRRRFFSKNGNGFFFSTSDLYTLDAIPDLVALGIRSLKIEGRLRHADYVRSVVTAYRMVLDADVDDFASVIPQAREVLSGALGRKWSSGFMSSSSMKTVVASERLGGSGRFIGVVREVNKGGFSLTLKSPLRCGDRIRVQPASGDEGFTIVLQKLSVNRRSVNRARAKQDCFVHCNREVPRDGRVYLIGHEVGNLATRINAMPALRGVVDLTISVTHTELTVKTIGVDNGVWRCPLNLEPAENRPLSHNEVERQFMLSGHFGMEVGTVTATVHGKLFMPASILKKHRREFYAWLEDTVTDDVIATMIDARVKRAIIDVNKPIPRRTSVTEDTYVLADAKKKKEATACICVPLGACLDGADEVMLPDFCSETDLDRVKKELAAAISNGIRRVRVTSLYGLSLVEKFPQTEITATFPLPVANSMALLLLMEAGVTKATIWVELDKHAAMDLTNKAKTWLEIVDDSVLPILSTRAVIDADGIISDGRGETFVVHRENGLTNLYPDGSFSMPIKGISRTFDHRQRPLTPKKSTFNWELEFK